jgi:carbonic anhydrase
MNLFESIVEANHRAVAGDASAGLHPAEFAEALPIIALTCIDPRLNAFFPNILGIPAEEFIWLRNAGNIITSPLSSTMRSLALACAVKGGKEIAIIGHTDCQVAKTTTMQLLEKLKALGVERAHLPENLNEFFGMFATERQNVIKACDFVRRSPLIGPRIPVHGLLADIETGKLEWIVNGYQTLVQQVRATTGHLPQLGGTSPLEKFEMGEMKFPETKIGEWVSNKASELKLKVQPAAEAVEGAVQEAADYAKKNFPKASQLRPPKIPSQPPKVIAPPIRPLKDWRR